LVEWPCFPRCFAIAERLFGVEPQYEPIARRGKNCRRNQDVRQECNCKSRF
jgi:hypothetical protein